MRDKSTARYVRGCVNSSTNAFDYLRCMPRAIRELHRLAVFALFAMLISRLQDCSPKFDTCVERSTECIDNVLLTSRAVPRVEGEQRIGGCGRRCDTWLRRSASPLQM